MGYKLQLFFFCLILFFADKAIAHVGLIYPEGGESFNPGDILNIQWYVEIDHGDCTWDLYFSTNNGQSWDSLITGLQKSQLNYNWTIPESLAKMKCKIQVVQNNISESNYSDQSPQFTIGSLTGISYENSAVKSFDVFPAYPNPFNNSTVISFNLPEQSKVEINVYNIMGKKIALLLNSQLPGGLHKIRWSAENFPSGIYLYEIKSGTNAEIRKLILLK